MSADDVTVEISDVFADEVETLVARVAFEPGADLILAIVDEWRAER